MYVREATLLRVLFYLMCTKVGAGLVEWRKLNLLHCSYNSQKLRSRNIVSRKNGSPHTPLDHSVPGTGFSGMRSLLARSVRRARVRFLVQPSYLPCTSAGLPPCVPPFIEYGGQCVETCPDFHYGQVNSTGYGHCEPCEWVYTALIEWSQLATEPTWGWRYNVHFYVWYSQCGHFTHYTSLISDCVGQVSTHVLHKPTWKCVSVWL